MAGRSPTKQRAHIVLGPQCASLPWLAWLPAACTDYSDTLNFSLSIFCNNRCGNPYRLSLSVRLSLFQACHGFVVNGNACASVHSSSAQLSMQLLRACERVLLSLLTLSSFRRPITLPINTTYLIHVHFIKKGVAVWQ